MNEQNLDNINSCLFFCEEAEREFHELRRLAAEPISEAQVKAFNAAKSRFWLAASRARREHAAI